MTTTKNHNNSHQENDNYTKSDDSDEPLDTEENIPEEILADHMLYVLYFLQKDLIEQRFLRETVLR